MARTPLPVPPVEVEEHHWLAETDGMQSRSAMARASGPCESTRTPQIANLDLTLPTELAADAEDAAAALTRFNTYASWRLGSHSPSLGPMSAILLRTESASSSQIENLTAGARNLALAEIDETTSANAKLVVANVRAMEAALDLADKLDTNAILAVHAELLANQPGWESHAGKLREQLVWVGSSAITPRGAQHVAPQPAYVPDAMEDLVRFMRREDLPVIVQAAIAHAQLETIHPFVDGNGRTGRAVVHALVRSKGLVTDTTAPISAGLLRNTAGYIDALTAYRAGDARPIVERFSEAARFAASSGAELVDALADELDSALDRLSHLRSDATAKKVVPHLVAHPVINAAFLQRRLALSGVTAQRALAQLADAEVLDERTGKRRGRVWQHTGIIDVLDDYARSLRRR